MFLIAIVLPDRPTVGENLAYQLTGLLVVLSALGFLALVIKLVGILFSVRREPPRDSLAPRPASTAPFAAGSGGTPPAIIAVIAAAVDAVFGEQGRILSIHEHAHPAQAHLDPKLLAWSLEGRRQIFSSHQPR